VDRSKISLALFLFLALTITKLSLALAVSTPSFNFHLKETPSLNPAKMNSGDNIYLFTQLYRGLTRLDGTNQLIFDQAKRCRFKTDTEMICELRHEAVWSDGSPVKAPDFVRSLRRLINPNSRFPAMELLFAIKNGKKVFLGQMPIESFGVNALDDEKLQFLLEEKDTEFLEKLSNPLLTPFREPRNSADFTTYPTNGPYKIKSWQKNKKIELAPFDLYYGSKKNRPSVGVYFASEDSAGLMLYEKGIINFLWRLTTINIPKYKERPDFLQIPLSRYDYIGFNMRPGSPFEKKEIRKAFAHSINFEDFKKVFFALGRPGCPGLGEPLLNPDGHCVDYVPSLPHLSIKPIKFMFSQAGGDDLRRSAEWFQAQWRDNLGVTLNLRAMDQKQYLSLLRKDPPDAFRIGVPINRPTCLAGLEKFRKDNKDNFTGFYNQRFENLVQALSTQKLSLSEKEGVCGVASDILFKEEFIGIPLGRIHFSMLMDPHFKGWTLNSLNQLDLSQLTYSP
jgi:oligopeptide transport system substrate-binding protein